MLLQYHRAPAHPERSDAGNLPVGRDREASEAASAAQADRDRDRLGMWGPLGPLVCAEWAFVRALCDCNYNKGQLNHFELEASAKIRCVAQAVECMLRDCYESEFREAIRTQTFGLDN